MSDARLPEPGREAFVREWFDRTIAILFRGYHFSGDAGMKFRQQELDAGQLRKLYGELWDSLHPVKVPLPPRPADATPAPAAKVLPMQQRK